MADKWGMGLEFRELSAVQRKALYHQVNEALRRGVEEKPGTPPSPAQLAARRSAEAHPQKKRPVESAVSLLNGSLTAVGRGAPVAARARRRLVVYGNSAEGSGGLPMVVAE